MASEAECTAQLKTDIIQYLQDQEESLSVFRNLIENKDVVICLGNTRSGKSTVVNYVIGNKLEGSESGKREYKIKKMDDNDGPEIGQGSLSCTTLPGVYRIEGNSDVVVVDPPGFEDNRGIVQDIINALCINQIVYARTVKFVLVFDINEITSDNIRNFTNTLHQVEDLVCNFDKLKRSFAFIFTKDWRNYTQDEMVELLQNKILNQDQLAVDRTLVANVAANKNLIGIFKMPSQEGEITSELEVNVNGAIKECHSVDVEKCEIMFAFSDKAQEALLQIYPEYTDTNYFKAETDKIIQSYDEYFAIDKYVFASYNLELTNTKEKLVQLQLQLEVHKDRNPTCLFEIQHSLDELLQLPSSSEFKANFKFVIMLDQSSMLEEQYKEMMKANYALSLSNLHTKVTTLLAKIDAEFVERKKTNFIYAASGLASIVGIGPALAGVAKAIETTIQTGSKLRAVVTPVAGAYAAAEGAIGTVATVGACFVGVAAVGAGAGCSYVLYKETNGKRNDARRAQNRPMN